MNKDRVEGKVKDIAGRVQRQAGEWTDDPAQEVKGAAKQAEGKVQNVWGKAKDATKESVDENASKAPRKTPAEKEEDDEAADRRRAG